MDNGELLRQLKIDRGQREAVRAAPLRWPWIAGGAVLLLALLGLGGWWMLAERPVLVRTATASVPGSGDAGAVLQATGYVTARRQATVSAQITGTLTDVLIEEGDHVTKGQVLARLEDSAYRANLEAARASARAAQAQVGQLQAQRAQARHDAARQDALVGRGLVARQAAEQAHTQVDALAAQLRAQRRQAEAARAQAQVAQVNFDYTVVRAPFDGVVTDKAAQ
ncbi:MAG TPA: biotin/lipoyl-binding protein, partial [Frateuria sp.]|uniref:efflux RND transporter periplasmic adaptor subunit n=1 Tax=Frateuria sp. TaxID=2211372 RepID=UPI002D7E54E0